MAYIQVEAVEDMGMESCEGCGQEHRAFVLELANGETIEVAEKCAPKSEPKPTPAS